MNLKELEEKLRNEELLTLEVDGVIKKYTDGNKIISDNSNSWSNIINVFGIFKGTDNRYHFFIMDEERGIPNLNIAKDTEEEACDLLYTYISNAKKIAEKKREQKLFISSVEVNKIIKTNIINGEKVPHSASYPVIRMENNKYYLASFVFFYNREDMQNGMINRPSMWALADLKNGEIIERRETKDHEFSSADYSVKYDVNPEKKYDLSKEYYSQAFDHLDKVRKELIEKNSFNFFEYNQYLSMILENIPENYKRFYKELSM